MARASADLIAPGLMLGGYRVDAVIGRGANACVARATRLADDSTVAVKVFTIAGADADDRVRRLFHEARAGTAVEYRSLVKVLDLGGVTHRPPYLVMEYLSGGSLAAQVQERGVLSVDDTVALVAEVGGALDALHRLGLVHRDVTPSNVLFRADGSAALADLGLMCGGDLSVMTKPGQVLGTLDYLAPELLDGERATPASDLYSLGCVVHACLLGHPPFANVPAADVGRAHLERRPPDLTAARADVSREFAEAVELALAKKPGDRPQTATAFARLLRAVPREQSTS